jgi:hypothetical protein
MAIDNPFTDGEGSQRSAFALIGSWKIINPASLLFLPGHLVNSLRKELFKKKK